MISFILAVALALGPSFAEKTKTARPALATPPAFSGCDASEVGEIVGRRFDEGLSDRAKDMTGATLVRVARPGEAVTMDFRADRLTLDVDAGGVVLSARCG